MSLRYFLYVFFFLLCIQEDNNIHCVSGTCCIALTTPCAPPTCQERVPHKLQNYLQMFCLLLTAPARWCLLSFAPAVSKQKWKTFCSQRSQQRQTLNVISHRGRAACNSGVLPLPPLHPSSTPSPFPTSPLPTSRNGLRVFFLESPICCCADGLAGTAVRSATSPAVASQVRMKWKFWDLSLPRPLPGCK